MHIIETIEMVTVPKKVKKVVLELNLVQVNILKEILTEKISAKSKLGAEEENIVELNNIFLEAARKIVYHKSSHLAEIIARDSNVCQMCKCPERRHYDYCPKYKETKCT